MLAGSLFGADAGVRTLGALSAAGTLSGVPVVQVVVDVTFILFLVGAAAVFWIEGGKPRSTAPLARLRFGPSVTLPKIGVQVSAIVVAWVGFALGFVSGLLGVGGGVALLPILVYGFGFPIRQAAGTGIVVLLATAIYGTVLHALRGNVELGLAMALLAGATPMAQVGALVTSRLPAASLRRMFAGVVLITAVAVIWDLARRLV
jgi:hypothetical protein